MKLLMPEMGLPLIQIETDTDTQGAVSEVFSSPYSSPSCFIALISPRRDMPGPAFGV